MKGIQGILLFVIVGLTSTQSLAEDTLSVGYRIDLESGSEYFEYYPRGFYVHKETDLLPAVPLGVTIGHQHTDVWGSGFSKLNDFYVGAELGFDLELEQSNSILALKAGYRGQVPSESLQSEFWGALSHQGHLSASLQVPVNEKVITQARFKVTGQEGRALRPTVAGFWVVSPTPVYFIKFGMEVSTAFSTAEGFETFGAQTELGMRF